jgi:hypothetical protein
MKITHGMDVEEVDALSQLVSRKAEPLRSMVVETSRCVDPVVWEGPLAARSMQQWWPDHRVQHQPVSSGGQGR